MHVVASPPLPLSGGLEGGSYVSQRCVHSKMAAVPSAGSVSPPAPPHRLQHCGRCSAGSPALRLLYFLPLFLSPFFIIAFYLMGSARGILMHRLISIQQHRRFTAVSMSAI